MIRGLARVFAAVLAASPAHTNALEIVTAAVEFARPQLSIHFEANLDAQRDRVRELATDYAGLARFSPLLRAVTVEAGEAGRKVVTAQFRICLLFVCRNLDKVTSTGAANANPIVHRVVRGRGDFRDGEETLTLVTTAAGHTRLRYEARLATGFFVPPLIGPVLIERRLRRELAEAAGRLESAAAPP